MYQSLKGLRDFDYKKALQYEAVEKILAVKAKQFGFCEVRLPTMERTEVFSRGAGEQSDIVKKEMYSFLDKEDNSISLRPEGTAGCVRALIENGWERSIYTRFFYMGSMFRFENPQAGRYREFYQFGMESFCNASYDSDVEILLTNFLVFKELNLQDNVKLKINFLSISNKEAFAKALFDFLAPLKDNLDQDSQQRLGKNTLRILDTKSEETLSILQNAPKLADFYSEEEVITFSKIQESLKNLNIDFVVDDKLVRGLDYYTGLVFEWVDCSKSGAQNAVCSGGRYNNLVEELGGVSVPAVGCGYGIDRLVEMCSAAQDIAPIVDIYIVYSESALSFAQNVQSKIITKTSKTVVLNKGLGGWKKQFKRASDMGASYALVIGDDEVKQNKVAVKNLKSGEQVVMTLENVFEMLSKQ